MEVGKQNVVVDTSVFMSNMEIDKLIDTYHIIIPYVVVEELDKLKGIDSKSYNARRAIRFIENNLNRFDFADTKISYMNNDDIVIDTAKTYGCGLITKDLNMKIKCKALGIPVFKIDNVIDDYKGYKEMLS